MTYDLQQGLAKIFYNKVDSTAAIVTTGLIVLDPAHDVLDMASSLYKLGFQADADLGLSKLFHAASTAAIQPGDFQGRPQAEQVAFRVAEKMQLKA